ncbi:LysM peptidoglycan-binding domain-containing protein [Candidatus Woesearchaeota archaeon]|jgi:hypothetical protein|nr:LysM peptidoglycan-binding domain-containing protein [Candidatus Woesearchaeota archaeon]
MQACQSSNVYRLEDYVAQNFRTEPEVLMQNPAKGFVNSISPTGYITTVTQELKTRGEVYSKIELTSIRAHLKDAYAQVKHKKNKSLLSNYRSSLARIARFSFQAEMTEGKTLDELLTSTKTNEYQKFILAKYHLANQSYTKLRSSKGLASIDRACRLTNEILETKLRTDQKVTFGEQKAYDALMTELMDIRISAKYHEPAKFEELTLVHETNLDLPPQTIIPEISHPLIDQIGYFTRRHASSFLFMCGVVVLAWQFQMNCASNKYVHASSSTAKIQLDPNYGNSTSQKTLILKPNKITPQTQPPILTKQEVLPPGKYRVQKGDILWNLAQQFRGDPDTWENMAEESDVEEPTLLQIGTIINKISQKKNSDNTS